MAEKDLMEVQNMNPKVYIAVALLALLALPFAAAQEDAVAATEPTVETIEAVDAEIVSDTGGTAPDSIFYGLDLALDRLTLILTFDRAEKARKGLQIARERLLEAKEMARKGKVREAETAAKEYENAADEAAADAEAIPDDGTEAAASDALEDSAGIEEQSAGLEEAAEIAKERVRARLVAEGLSEEQLAHLQQVFERIEAHAAAVREKIAQKKERALLKLRAIKNATEAEAGEDLDAAEIKAKVKEHREKRVKREIVRTIKKLREARDKISEAGAADVSEELGSTETALDEAQGIAGEDAESAEDMADETKEYADKVSEIAKRLRAAKAAGNLSEVRSELRALIRARHIAVLERVLAKVPEGARPAISTVLERARERMSGMSEGGEAEEPAEEQVTGADETSEQAGEEPAAEEAANEGTVPEQPAEPAENADNAGENAPENTGQ